MKNNTVNNDIQKEPTRRRYIIVPALFLLITGAMVYIWLTQEETKPDPASELIIRKAAANQIYMKTSVEKDPNDLTDEDFAKIEVINLVGKSLCSIHLIEKFINLRELDISLNKPLVKKIPKWKKFLSKYGIIHIPTLSSRLGNVGTSLGFGDEEVCSIDLSPLKKLHNLEKINLGNGFLDFIKVLQIFAVRILRKNL